MATGASRSRSRPRTRCRAEPCTASCRATPRCEEGKALPELPDVEVFRRYLEATSLHRRIADVDVLAPGSVRDVPAKALRDAVAGRRFVGTERRGKNLLVQTDGGPWVAMHFGMTGHLESLDAGDPRPKQDRVEFVFADAGRLAFVDQRRFGGVRLVPDPEAFFAGKKLGPDALTLKPRQVAELLGRRRGAVKGVLMDQSVIAGLGNLYADEVLFQAGVNPKRRVEDLSVEELRRIGEQTGKVLRKAIEAHVEARRMPDTWLLRHRREGEVCPLAGGTVRRTKVAGRTTYYCDERQPERA